ncbi:hypothetical protein HHL19_08095 [Streptomyces sp. R302]|uniref:hypothetical protein n=1 Tax=unclassified Streptomyces TaxID=2593676 RepID=UPI00145CF30B|nr:MULTISPECIES: hypothetical protein [unclassified Streptomyces]NML52790.1 hypothetical protein [Streptomyces sp. R301]NML78625.1 hypothetical protein [Streptomyces sp. R302]
MTHPQAGVTGRVPPDRAASPARSGGGGPGPVRRITAGAAPLIRRTGPGSRRRGAEGLAPALACLLYFAGAGAVEVGCSLLLLGFLVGFLAGFLVGLHG